jgi:hypothetical protein
MSARALTHSDWQAACQENAEQLVPPAEQQQQVNMLIQAAVSMEKLTNDPDWDKFVSYIQGALELVQEQAVGYKERLADPLTVGQEDIARIKAALTLLKGQELALEWLIDIPKALKAQGDLARDFKTTLPET